jgi:phage shock protein A
MSFFRRVTLAVSTQLDRMVGEIENHDAVVEAGIRESRRLYAKARVRHERMRQDGERLKRRLDGLRRDEGLWRERALACAAVPEGEEKALTCLSRAKRAASQAEAAAETYRQHTEVARRLGHEIDGLRQRVETLEHKRQLMRSREATAEAASRIRETDQGALLDLDDTFERWEIRLTEAELTTDTLCDSDPLEAEMVAAEERADLRAELESLKRQAGRRSGDDA